MHLVGFLQTRIKMHGTTNINFVKDLIFVFSTQH